MTQAAAETTDTSRKIGLIPCLAFAVGTMIGGGVFTLSGVAVDMAGPSALFGYLIAGTVMLLSALSFSAVASRSKPGDSGYASIGGILGPQWRFLTMWAFYLSAVTGVAFVLISFGSYLRQYFAPSVPTTTAAVVAAVALALLNLGPADVVGRAETFLVALKIAILLLLVVYGVVALSPGDLQPLEPQGNGSVLRVTAMLFTAYTGFNVVTNMAGSVRRPERTVPLAIVLSILISAAVYVGVIIALLASGEENFGEAGLGKAAEALMGPWGGVLVAFAACISTLSGANANVLGSSELMIKLAAQGDVAGRWGKLTPHHHPAASVFLATAMVIVLVAIGDLDVIVALSNVTAITAMLIVNVAAFQLARQGWPEPGMRLRGGAALPVVAFVTAAAQFPSLGWSSVAIGLGLVLAGLFIYALRHRPELGADTGPLLRAIERLETPLARALRERPKRHAERTS
ncbi:MAG TPA: APC family permease [Nocardioidaceae bacterium]|nr:APC family permease [Nocardioidaceae bacterium]